MLALYRSGRQADALGAYQAGRRTLGDELGLEPGPELRELEAAILRQDAGSRSTARVQRARRRPQSSEARRWAALVASSCVARGP